MEKNNIIDKLERVFYNVIKIFLIVLYELCYMAYNYIQLVECAMKRY